MSNGVKTVNLPNVGLLESVIGESAQGTVKAAIATLAAQLDAQIGVRGPMYETPAQLDQDLNWQEGMLAGVWGDDSPGVYSKIGDAAEGSWVRTGDLPLSAELARAYLVQIAASGTQAEDAALASAASAAEADALVALLKQSQEVTSLAGFLIIDLNLGARIVATLTEDVKQIKFINWPEYVNDVTLVIQQPEDNAFAVDFPLSWAFDGDTPPRLLPEAGVVNQFLIQSPNMGKTISFVLENQWPVNLGDQPWDQVSLPYFSALDEDIRVPLDTKVLYVGFTLDRAAVSTVNAFVLSTAGSIDPVGITFPAGEYFVWRTGDDLVHYVEVDVSALAPVQDDYFQIALDGTHYPHPTEHVTIVFDDAAPTHSAPDKMPFHRPPRRVFMNAGPAPVYDMDMDTIKWTETGYDETGAPCLQARLGGGNGHSQNANPEFGLYMNKDLWPTESVNPISIATNGVGKHILLNSTKLPAPVEFDGKMWNYQAAVVTGLKMPETHLRHGLWRITATVPSRQYAWSALWCTGVLEVLGEFIGRWCPEIDFQETSNANDQPMTGYANAIGQHSGKFGKGKRELAVGSMVLLDKLLGAAAPNMWTDAVEYVLSVDQVTDEVTVFMNGIEVFSALWTAKHEDPNNTDWGLYPIMNVAVHSDVGTGPYDDGDGSMKIYGFKRYDGELARFTEVPAAPPIGLLASFDPNKNVTLSPTGVQNWGSTLNDNEFSILDTSRRPILGQSVARGSKFLEFKHGLTVTSGTVMNSEFMSKAPAALTYCAALKMTDLTKENTLLRYNHAFGFDFTLKDANTLHLGLAYRTGEEIGTAAISLTEDQEFILSIRVSAGNTWSVRIDGVEVASGTTTEVYGALEDAKADMGTMAGEVYYLGLSETYMTDVQVAQLESYASLVARMGDLVPYDFNGDFATVDDEAPAAPGSYTEAALKVLKINAVDNKRTVSDGAASVTITEYEADSTINGTPLAGGGTVDETDVPTFLSGDLFTNWIIKQPADQLIGHNSPLTFAPGNSKAFLFEGQVFEFAHGKIGAASCTIRWSEDGGKTWLQAYKQWDYNVAKKWIQVDFGSAAPRVVEVIGEDQGLQTYGFNFDMGDTPPAPFIDPDIPLFMELGDSLVFGQGSGDFGNGIDEHPNNQRATSGMARKTSEHIGGLQVYPHGLRTNGFAAQYRPTPTQSNYADRIKCPTIPEFSEGSLYGPLDLVVIPSSYNDDVLQADPIRRDSVAAAFANMRELQPDALIVFPVGARPPQFTERDVWLDDLKNGFNDVFGTTEAEHIANGAYLHDGSRRDGADWTPAGAGTEGSNPHFGVSAPTGDPGHPTALGHDFLGQKYAEGAVALAKKVTVADAANGAGTDIYAGFMGSVGTGWTETEAPAGVFRYDAVGADTVLRRSSPSIDGANVYVVSFTVSGLTAGSVSVYLGGGEPQTVDQNGAYAFAFNDAVQNNFTIAGNGFTGTISNIGCRKMTV